VKLAACRAAPADQPVARAVVGRRVARSGETAGGESVLVTPNIGVVTGGAGVVQAGLVDPLADGCTH